ncbi:MAG TPA: hypothetical protein VLS27_12600 [Gammaproteobacteria bacterium]|nr:hypothetical protein [Gammaproteobacteria bacterium]
MQFQKTGSFLKETNVTPAEAEMDRYGITKVQVDYFHYKGFRHANLKDAVAQAKRDELRN